MNRPSGNRACFAFYLLQGIRRGLFALYLLLSFIRVDASGITDSLETLLPQQKDTQRVQTLCNLCWEYRNISPDKAIRYGQKAIKEAEALGSPRWIAQASNDLGIIYNDLADFPKALELYSRALDIRKKIKDNNGMAALHLKIGIVFQKQGKLKEALTHQLKALTLFEKTDNKLAISYCLNNIALIHYNLGNNVKALAYHEKSLEMKKQLGDEYGQCGSLVNIGNIYFEEKKYKEAASYLMRALGPLRKIGDREYLSACLNNLASIYIAQSRYVEALPLIKEAIQIREAERDKKGLLSAFVNLGEVYAKTGNKTGAREAYEKALKFSDSTTALYEQEKLYRNLALMYEAEGNYREAFRNLRISGVIKDTLQYDGLNKAVAEMQIKYETEKREKENEVLRIKNLENNLNLQQSRFRITILIISLVLVLLAAVFVFYLNRSVQRQKLQHAMSEQEKLRYNSVIETQENEQRRIAGELHDGIGQMLAAVRIKFSAMQKLIPEQHHADFDGTLELLDKSCNELRGISHSMMPSVLEKYGLAEAAREMVRYSTHPGGPEIFLDIHPSSFRLSRFQEINTYRMLQEALHNALKHARATEIHIQISLEDQKFTLLIEDNGTGFKKEEKFQGNGINNLEVRCRLLQAHMELDTSPGKGTAILIDFLTNGNA